jgi:uncharacterized protein (TIGR03437 family)
MAQTQVEGLTRMANRVSWLMPGGVSEMRIRITRFLVLAAVAAPWGLFATGAALAAAGGNPAAAYIREDDRYIYAGNDRVELTFQMTDGRLYSLMDKTSQLDFLARKEAWWGPFNFQINITGQDEYINGSQASRFTYAASSDKDGPMLSLNWEQFRASRPTPLDVRVSITVHIPSSDGLTYWNIAVTNNEAIIIRQVAFPDLEGIPQLSRDGRNDELTLPAMSGVLFQDPLNNFRINSGLGWEYPSTFATMQFMTYSSREQNSGLYLATRDAGGYSKYFSFLKPAQNWINMVVLHHPPLTPKTSFAPAYDAVVGVYTGNWYEAAQMYRGWALQQPWVMTATVPNVNQPTSWLSQLPLHQWVPTTPTGDGFCQYSFPFSQVATVSQDTAQFMGQPVVIDWIGWERDGWYIDYPDVLPPKEGWFSFEESIRKTHELGNRVMAILDTTSYSDILAGWASDKGGAATGEGGQYLNTWQLSECGRNATFRAMCPATDVWRERLRNLILPLASRQVDVIELDGFPIFGPLPCTNPAHSHPPGGGNWWYLSYRDIFEGIKREARQLNPGIVFNAEGGAEVYLSFLDSVWDPFTTGFSPVSFSGTLLDIGKFHLIPMWHAVYHDKALIQSGIAFISTSGFAEVRDFYAYGFGQALVWGEAPTTWWNYLDLNTLPEPGAPEMAAYVKRIVSARTGYASRFLVNGRMLRPPVIQVPLFHNPGAKSIPYTLADYPPFDTPAVAGSLWQAPNGDAGYVFTNVSHDPVKFDLLIDAASTLLTPEGRYEVSLIRNGLPSVVQAAASLPVAIPVNIDPMDVILIGVSPSGSSSSLLPAINQGGVTEAMNFQQGVTASSWISIFGRNLSATTHDWTGAPELAQNKLPFVLDGVSITINGKPAAVSFVSPGQVNVLSPADIGTGSMSVIVKNANGQSAPATVTGTTALPAFYAPFADSGGNLFVTAVAVNGDLLGKVGLDPRVKRALRPGEIVLLFGTGFGDTSPVAPTDSVFTGAYPLRTLPVIRFGNVTASVAFGGIVSPGLYQFNLTVPEIPDGDVPVTAQIGAIQSSSKLMVSIKH